MTTPYFLWDYTLTDRQITSIIKGTNQTERLWLIGRILTHARYEDIWKFLSLRDILETFPNLRLDTRTKEAWHHALTIWGYHV